VLSVILRLSQKLNSKLKVGRLGELPLDENPYADWSAHVFVVDRTQYIILCNTASLYSCVMYGKGISDAGRFIERALSTIREFMEADGLSDVYQEFFAPSSATVTFAIALNRKVTGSLNELVMSATFALESREVAPHQVGFDLNGLLLSAIASKEDRGYGKPREAFLRLLERCPK
jgi:hypothetical protein